MAGFFVACGKASHPTGGEGRLNKSPEWGRCAEANAAIVCSRGESLTIHITQIKLFNAIAAAAVIGNSLLAVAPENATTIYDLENRTKTYIDDKKEEGKIIRDGMTLDFFMVDPGGSPGTSAISDEDYKYANDRFDSAIEARSTLAKSAECKRKTGIWTPNCERERQERTAERNSSATSCPPGKRQYQKTALFGLIKGKTLCLSDYEAESLRAQQQRDIQNNIRNNQPRFINCTSNIYGNYVSTSCY